MNQSHKLSVSMSYAEQIAGWIYFPFYLVLLGWILSAIFRALGHDPNSVTGQVQLNLIFGLVNFSITVLIFHRYLFASLKAMAHRVWGLVQAVILGLAFYWIGTYLVSLLARTIVPTMQNLNNAAVSGMVGANSRAMLIFTVFLAPMVEESLFRGLIFSNCYRKNRILAFAVSMAAFAAVHILGFFGQASAPVLALSFAEYLPAGFALAWAYEKADTVFAPVIMHMVINAMSMGLIDFLV